MPRPPARTVYRRRRAPWVLVLALAALAVVVAVTAGRGPGSAPPPPLRPFTAGRGARSALVLPARGQRRRPAVLFLHGWGLTGRTAYRSWLRHLTVGGSTVVVPRYQTSLDTPSTQVPANAVAGVRAALRRLRPRPSGFVVVGHSVGGVLAIDYAVEAAGRGLPPALAVVSIYPGGAFKTMPPIPQDASSGIPASTRRLLVMASPTDTIVGTGPAQAIYDNATSLPPGRRELVAIDDPVAGNHFAPAVDSPAARRAFWAPVDSVLAETG